MHLHIPVKLSEFSGINKNTYVCIKLKFISLPGNNWCGGNNEQLFKMHQVQEFGLRWRDNGRLDSWWVESKHAVCWTLFGIIYHTKFLFFSCPFCNELFVPFLNIDLRVRHFLLFNVLNLYSIYSLFYSTVVSSFLHRVNDYKKKILNNKNMF